MNKLFLSADELLRDSFELGWRVFESGFRPSHVVGIWRGGTPVGAAVQELLQFLGAPSEHAAIRITHYRGMEKRHATARVHALDDLTRQLRAHHALLLVDDIHDTGLSLDQAIRQLEAACGDNTPEIRTATVYFNSGNNRTVRTPHYYLHQTEQWVVFPHELDGLTLREIAERKPALAHRMEAIAAARASAR